MKADYSKGKVYIIKNHVNDMVYIGSTTSALAKRFSEHKKSCASKDKQHLPLYQDIYKYGIEVFYIELLEECIASDKLELHKREGYFIQKYKDDGCLLYNNYIAGRDIKEWYEDNKEKIKEYREVNEDKISQRKKEWYEANKEKILQREKEYYEANKDKIAQRMKEYNEANKDKISHQKKEYYEANKEKLAQYRKEHYEANKEKISQQVTCECGSVVTLASLARHKRTKKHISKVNTLQE